MQAGGPGVAALSRRGRVPCPRCGRVLDIARMRAHLRDGHQLGSSELDQLLLHVRREALRAGRAPRM